MEYPDPDPAGDSDFCTDSVAADVADSAEEDEEDDEEENHLSNGDMPLFPPQARPPTKRTPPSRATPVLIQKKACAIENGAATVLARH
ncbi:MAG: hypothetical protein ABSH20_08110 [Tepidisphaeraceae bacterium]